MPFFTFSSLLWNSPLINFPWFLHLTYNLFLLDYKESWALKNWCFWTVVLEKTLESPLDCKEIQPVHPKGNQSWKFIGKTDAEAETPILWPPYAKNWLLGKDPDAGNDWRWEEKGITEDEMVGWHHWLNGHGFGWTPGVGDGQGGLACCDSWDHKELDTIEQLNWTQLPSATAQEKVTLFPFRSRRTSLVALWLTFHTPNAGGLGSIPGQGTRYHMLQLDSCCN